MSRVPRSRLVTRSTIVGLVAVAAIVTLPASAPGPGPALPGARSVSAAPVATAVCTNPVCRFSLTVNPGLLPGHPFACPAIQAATGTIQVLNRFATGQQNDTMHVSVSGLPPNTGFDLFLVENSASPFGFGWYQSDLQSDAHGNASVLVRGIFDKETFIENPANPFVPIHTYNVGFWFNSPAQEQQVCGNSVTPPTTPFNGEQNAGLLAMITQGGPLQLVQ